MFKVSTDGSGYSIIHTFTCTKNDGNQPFGSLTLSGSTLYGMTYQGGLFSDGTVFSVSTNGGSVNVEDIRGSIAHARMLAKQGVIFLSSDDGLKQYPDIYKEYFGTVIPIEDNKFAALPD